MKNSKIVYILYVTHYTNNWKANLDKANYYEEIWIYNCMLHICEMLKPCQLLKYTLKQDKNMLNW